MLNMIHEDTSFRGLMVGNTLKQVIEEVVVLIQEDTLRG